MQVGRVRLPLRKNQYTESQGIQCEGFNHICTEYGVKYTGIADTAPARQGKPTDSDSVGLGMSLPP